MLKENKKIISTRLVKEKKNNEEYKFLASRGEENMFFLNFHGIIMKKIFCNFNVTIMVKSHSALCSRYIFFHLYHYTKFLHMNFNIPERNQTMLFLEYKWRSVCSFGISKFCQSILIGEIEVNFHFFSISLNDDKH